MKTDEKPKAPATAPTPPPTVDLVDMLEQANPTPTPDQDLAAQIAADIKAEEDKKRKAQIEATNAGALFFLQCDGCSGPALFFARSPHLGEVMQHGEWFSTLKPVGRPWQAGKLRCQNCNAKARVRYIAGQDAFVPVDRFVRAYPTDKPGVKEMLAKLAAFRAAQSQMKGGKK